MASMKANEFVNGQWIGLSGHNGAVSVRFTLVQCAFIAVRFLTAGQRGHTLESQREFWPGV